MIKFLSLGSGSSGNCYYLATENARIMIDTGVGIRLLKRYLRNYGLSLKDIDAIFITHDHADHIKAVGHVSEEAQAPVYATELVHQGIVRNYCVSQKIKNELIRVIQKTQTVTIGDMHVTAFDVPHDSTDCVGYRVQTDEETFCLVTDAGHVTQAIQQEIGMANFLVLEANHDVDMLMMGPYPAYLKGRIRSGRGHLCNTEAATLIAENASPELKHVWLCHLSEENNHPELARKTFETILRDYGIIAGVDFKLDVLRRKNPSELYELKN